MNLETLSRTVRLYQSILGFTKSQIWLKSEGDWIQHIINSIQGSENKTSQFYENHISIRLEI